MDNVRVEPSRATTAATTSGSRATRPPTLRSSSPCARCCRGTAAASKLASAPGRFAAPLGVEFGIDPAAEMLGHARARGIRVARAVAEALPFAAVEVERLLRDAGFGEAAWVQTLSTPLKEARDIKPLRSGRGQGAFVVVRATRLDPSLGDREPRGQG